MKNNALFFFAHKLQCLKVLIHSEKSYLKNYSKTLACSKYRCYLCTTKKDKGILNSICRNDNNKLIHTQL